MSNVNDNNLDDLLRRAAEKYPLRTDSANFGKLVADLEEDPSLILPPLNTEDRRRRRRFFWLFLLLPLAGGAYYAWHSASGRTHQSVVAQGQQGPGASTTTDGKNGQQADGEKTNNDNGVAAEIKKDGNGDNGIAADATAPGGGEKGANVPTPAGSDKGTIASIPAGSEKRPNTTISGGGEKRINAPAPGGDDKGTSASIPAGREKGPNATTSGGGEKRINAPAPGGGNKGTIALIPAGSEKGPNATAPGRGDKGTNAPTLVGSEKAANVRTPGGNEKRTDVAAPGRTAKATNATIATTSAGRERTTGTGSKEDGNEAGDTKTKEKSGKGAIGANGGAPESGNDAAPPRFISTRLSLASTKGVVDVNIPVRSTSPDGVKKSAAAKEKVKLQKPKHSFYVGILGSPDLSVVKFQSVKGTGVNYGLLLGYSFNSHWAVETGIYHDRKKYYTDGEYFDKTKVQWMNYIDQLKVDGACTMWEIPINVRYNFSSGAKMNWFATAGLSTYLMYRESYDCSGYTNGTYYSRPWSHDVSYQNWFSIFNLSIGYEQQIGKIGKLRLEPFVRAPLSGLGTGKLSITSAGLNIGITRRIW